MNIQMHAQGFPLSNEVRDHISRRLAYALNHGLDKVSRVVVRLADVNGPRGGVDKECSIEVRLKGAPAIVIEDTQAELLVAIDRATERAGRTLDRRLNRRQDHPGGPPFSPEAAAGAAA
ncbi:HPF/RaiA family ribosome-associated protein [Rhodocyclus tenuis]|uniref:HPF/RaiA family ribosome-associated protein n=1 Tax=Rhodocyclus tenuis TaxID=1066 RepID=UPI0019051692|nr:HPF/RaiA family ribosome-associated protein [Rhodocyclus tenuis]MBK1679797.1 30S ribosomal protein S30 [Rhodocyclus tenuis]